MSTRTPALGPRGEGWVAAQLVLFRSYRERTRRFIPGIY